MPLHLPTQATVDRSIPLDVYLVPSPVRDDQGNILEILEEPVGGPYGPLPGDGAWFPERIDSRAAAYQLAARYATIRCRLARSYF
jgi:hypothetical protein